MADGQADTAPGTLDDLAAFLIDNPELIEDEDQSPGGAPSQKPASARTRAEPGEDTQDPDAALAPGSEDSEPDDDAPPAKGAKTDDEEDEDANDRTRQRTHKVTVKGEDGS